MTSVILAAYRKKGNDQFVFPKLVIGVGTNIDECNRIAQEFANNNPDLINISWDYR